MPRDAVSRTANVGTVGKNGLITLYLHIFNIFFRKYFTSKTISCTFTRLSRLCFDRLQVLKKFAFQIHNSRHMYQCLCLVNIIFYLHLLRYFDPEEDQACEKT